MKKWLTTLNILMIGTVIGSVNNILTINVPRTNVFSNQNNNLQINNNHFNFNNLYKNNKGEIFSLSDDGVYKYEYHQNTFVKMKGINVEITDIKFDNKNNIYVLSQDGIYKCLADETKFKPMKVVANDYTYLFTSIEIDNYSNVYVYSNKDGVYKCLAGENEFNKIGGIHLSKGPNFLIILFFSKNNIYVQTNEDFGDYDIKLYKCLAGENEFTLIDYKSKKEDYLTTPKYITVDTIGNLYILNKDWKNKTTFVCKFLFAENRFIKITGLPIEDYINSNVSLRFDSKNNLYVLDLNNCFYKCLADETKFKEIKNLYDNFDGIRRGDIKFDRKDNLYLINIKRTKNSRMGSIYKCLAGENEFKPMIIEENYSIDNIIIDHDDNIYAIDSDKFIHKCLAGENKFKSMTGWPGIPWVILRFDNKNNVYAVFNNGIYKCLAGENEFKPMMGLSRGIKDIKFDNKNNIYVLAKRKYPYICLDGEYKFKEIINSSVLNNDNQFEVDYRFLAHDLITIKISYDIFLDMRAIYNDENKSNFIKLFYKIINDFPKIDKTGAGGILESDYNTAVEVIIKYFNEINEFFEKLPQGQGIKIVTNRIGSWDKIDNMGVFRQ